jgi:hypothetical protein
MLTEVSMASLEYPDETTAAINNVLATLGEGGIAQGPDGASLPGSIDQLDPESFEYGVAAVTLAATALQQKINTLAVRADPDILVEIKTDPLGATSPVTRHDKETERLFGNLYEGTGVRIKGEEKVTDWPEDEIPKLDIHVDPIDGTELFIEYLKELVAWTQLPEDSRPPRPVCGSMVSAGALRPGSRNPEWGAIAAPFMFSDGIVRWMVSPDHAAVCIEPDGSRHELPQADTLPLPETGGTILVASDSAERIFGPELRAAGYNVIKYKSAVATALCLMDPGLFERLRPGTLGDEPIVGVVMRTAKNWDVAVVVSVANKLGHFVSDTRGAARTFEDGANSAIIAVSEAIGRTLVRTVAPRLQT